MQRTLVLNQDYSFLGVCSLESAVCAWYTNKAIVECSYDIVWRSPSTEINVPAVIRLRKFVRVAYEKITYCSFTKHNIHLRDNYMCLYCGIKCDPRKITIDHIVPEDQGGLSTWENCCSCCPPCNSIKDNKTPQEAGMHLIKIPTKPKGFVQILKIKLGEINRLWHKYLGIKDEDGELV